MSAIRRNDRRVHRNNLASPYARPLRAHPPKKSLWSLSGLISFLNPFGSNGEPEDSDSGLSDGEIEQGSPPCRFSPPPPQLPPQHSALQHQSPSISSRPTGMNGPSVTSGHITQQPFSFATPPAASSSSLAKNLEPVTRFLVEKAGQPLNEFEAAGIVDYIQKNVQGSTLVPNKPEPFRFSVSPSRAASPSPGQGNIQAPRKTLSRNPNGVYRWQGAGSSRPRNRYQSPGFAPRSQQHRMKLSPPKTPVTTDTKRRRVGEEAESSTPQKPAVPSTSTARFPSPIPESPPPQRATGVFTTSLNGKPTVSSVLAPAPPATPKANGVQPRVRTSGLPMKPNTPAIPSPLRQAWKESDSPPQASPPSRPTRAADFMTELLKEVTPTKKSDVSNPYQTASPVKPPPPVRKPVAKRARPVAKPVEKPKERELEMSAQAIIEATVPKGTKRSRPPPEMERPIRVEEFSDGTPFASAVNGTMHTIRSAFTAVETITILDDEESASKRRKAPLAQPSSRVDEASAPGATIRPSEIIEPADETSHINGKPAPPPPTTVSPPTVTKPLFGIAKTSAPKEPSKLRYSFQADKVEVKGTDAVPPPPTSFFASPPVALPFISESATAPVKLPPKEEALAMDVDELPKYTFSVGTTSYPAGPSISAARTAVLSLAVTSLPTFDFVPIVAPVRPMDGFNWTAAGLKAPATSTHTWECSLCGLQNPADAKDKCTICDAPRSAPTDSSPAPPPPPPVAGVQSAAFFDWSAAGLAPPPMPSGGSWKCSLCGLDNPVSATDKCTICDAPR